MYKQDFVMSERAQIMVQYPVCNLYSVMYKLHLQVTLTESGLLKETACVQLEFNNICIFMYYILCFSMREEE